MNLNIRELETYSQQNPQEVLIITAEDNHEEVKIMIFKGFSSNLSGGTEFDPDVPILSSGASILKLDRVMSPYNPVNPQYIQSNLTPSEFLQIIRK
ncbi:hypothetical protein [Geminocystis sp. NIES-3709]|uniref:DUF7734 family protein n=1 Tax=Geminocystis sp. NIES-3709 TaxID=1617448 RepID=UPI0005FC9B4A|nr:hypothetical protein [Geminocystis sp. NIES-3709]BAQ63801.1 hypothetical protein GM3709_566 [Geminocystis sp. NIES-3709]